MDVLIDAYVECESVFLNTAAVPSLCGLSLPEVGLQLKSYICWSRGSDGALAGIVVQGCHSFERGVEFEDLLPFPLCAGASDAEVALSLAAGRGNGEDEQVIKSAGNAAWLLSSSGRSIM